MRLSPVVGQSAPKTLVDPLPSYVSIESMNEEPLETEEPEKKKPMIQMFATSLIDIMKTPTTRYVNIAMCFKYLGEYAFLFFMPAYF
jgi:hypothetical protein